MLTQTTARHATTIRVFLFAFASLLLPVGLFACSEEEAPVLGSTPTPSQHASTTPAPEEIADPFEAATAAYLRFRDVLDEAMGIPDPAYPQLSDVAADEGLEIARSIVQGLYDQGLRNTGKHTDEFEIKDWAPEDAPTQIALITCSDSSQTLVVHADTGEAAEGEEYGKRHVEALIELREGRWLVTDLAIRDIGSCLREEPESACCLPVSGWHWR